MPEISPPIDTASSGRTVGLIGGTGQMGRMFKRSFEAAGCAVLVAGRRTELTYEQLCGRADVVIVIVPVEDTIPVIRGILGFLRPSQLLSDFTSIKATPVAAMLEGPSAVIGCHPVFGPMADTAGQNVVLCPERPGTYGDWYQKFFQGQGMRVVQMTPQAHDDSMAFIQGLTHFLNITFARTLQTQGADVEKLLQICSPIYRLMFSLLSRILSGEAELYGQIQVSNPPAVPVLEDFMKNGGEMLDYVREKNLAGVTGLFNGAAEYLGDFRKQAREESDFLIQQIITYLKDAPGGKSEE